MTEAEALRAFVQEGDQGAFAELVKRHVDLVYAAARRQVIDAHLAEDVTQKVFILLAEKAAGVRPGVLAGWLVKSARLVARDVNRQAARRQRHEREAAMRQERGERNVEDAWEEIRPVLDDAMADLGDQDRTAIALRYLENRDLNAVGQAMGISQAAAAKRISRAVEKLRQGLGRRGVAVTGTALTAAMVSCAMEIGAPAVAAASVSAGLAVSSAASAGGGLLMAKAATVLAVIQAKAAVLAVLAATAIGAVGWVAVQAMGPSSTQPAASAAVPMANEGAPTSAPAFIEQEEMLTREGRRPNGDCEISGTVLAEQTGAPIMDCGVFLFSVDTHDGIRIRPASDGTFSFRNIAAGSYSLQVVYAPGFQHAQYNPSGTKQNLPQFALRPSQKMQAVMFKLARALRVSGKVLGEDGKPAPTAGRSVLAWQEQRSADGAQYAIVSKPPEIMSDGSYVLDGLDGTPVYIMAIDYASQQKDDAYPPCYYPGTFSRAEAKLIEFEKGKSVEGVDIRLRKGGGLVLEGRVTDKVSGEGIANALVVVHHSDMLFDRVTAYSDQKGNYRIESLGEGECSVNVDATPWGFVRSRREVKLAAGSGPTRLDLTLSPGVTIQGKFARPDGQPVQIGETAVGWAFADAAPTTMSSISFSGVPNRFGPGAKSANVTYSPGEGEYATGEMIFPTRDTFLLMGIMPGKTRLEFQPKMPGQRVERVEAHQEEAGDTFTTEAKDVIDDVVIVIAEDGK